MQRIKQLSKDLINKISAGAVIERPANIIKELVENSIDAGSSKIEITVSSDCRSFRVADNGCGIHPDDIVPAFSKHATSKISTAEDLFDIETLGFRGEALASMISVAKVICTTKTADCEYGTIAKSKDSEISFSKTGCANGTVMEVNDLFYNQSARLKFMKSPKTEFGYISDYVTELALSRPEIGFVLKNGDNTVLNLSKSNEISVRISDIFSPSIIKELREINKTDELSGLKVTGFASVPSYTRSSKKTIYTFVNSRAVKCKILLKAVELAYKSMLPNGRYPFVVLNLELPYCDVDVNAHPTKREIRYKNPNQIFNFVQSAVNSALNSFGFDNKIYDNNYDETKNIIPFEKSNVLKNDDNDDEIISPKDINPFLPVSFDFKRENNAYSPIQRSMDVKFDVNIDNEKKDNIIGQFKNTYILVEKDDCLEIVDQHIAEERYLYEKLKKQREIVSQLLIISDVLDVDKADMQMIDENQNILVKFGYKIEKVSETQIIFKKIPQILSKEKTSDILSSLLENLRNSETPDTKEEKILKTTACKASVKAGDKLSPLRMEEIISHWRTTENPYTCPHGRPIFHKIPLKEIASYFFRNV